MLSKPMIELKSQIEPVCVKQFVSEFVKCIMFPDILESILCPRAVVHRLSMRDAG